MICRLLSLEDLGMSVEHTSMISDIFLDLSVVALQAVHGASDADGDVHGKVLHFEL